MTNADEVVEKLPKYMFYVDEDGKASMMLDPIGAYVHIADLKPALEPWVDGKKRKVLDILEGYIETAKGFKIRLVLDAPMLVPTRLSVFKKKIRITVEEIS